MSDSLGHHQSRWRSAQDICPLLADAQLCPLSPCGEGRLESQGALWAGRGEGHVSPIPGWRGLGCCQHRVLWEWVGTLSWPSPTLAAGRCVYFFLFHLGGCGRLAGRVSAQALGLVWLPGFGCRFLTLEPVIWSTAVLPAEWRVTDGGLEKCKQFAWVTHLGNPGKQRVCTFKN